MYIMDVMYKMYNFMNHVLIIRLSSSKSYISGLMKGENEVFLPN